MESILGFLIDTTELEVRNYLDATYPLQKGPTWIDAKPPNIYIDFYKDSVAEILPEDWQIIVKALGRAPDVSVIADVSGRASDGKIARAFISSLLKRFRGIAIDDFSPHPWTVDQIDSGFCVDGHVFFDTLGWYNDTKIGD